MHNGKIPIAELFGPVIQGEGALCGQISYFIRTMYCSYRCVWCDSMHAVDPRLGHAVSWLTPVEVADRFQQYDDVAFRPWITLSGGDPCLWDLSELCIALHTKGYRIAVETQGARFAEWLTYCDLVTCSPKGPSSGMDHKLNIKMLQHYVARLYGKLHFKVVVFDDKDLAFAERIHKWMPKIPFYISSGTPTPPQLEQFSGDSTDRVANLEGAIIEGYRNLSEEILKRQHLYDVTVLPQVHALMYGRELGR